MRVGFLHSLIRKEEKLLTAIFGEKTAVVIGDL